MTDFFRLAWADTENDIKEYHGVFESEGPAYDSIRKWWSLNNFRPEYVRRWTEGNTTTIDYGSHTRFYFIEKITYDGNTPINTRIFNAFEEIRNTSTKDTKMLILNEARLSIPYFDNVVRFLFNDFFVTGLAMKKINKKVESKSSFEKTNVLDVIDYLEEHSTGKDEDIEFIQSFLKDIDDEDVQTFMKQLFTKTYKCGITVKSVNKAFGKNIIPEFNCQLAHPYSKYEHKVNGPFFITQKLDGHRTITSVHNGKVTFYTRKGHIIEGLEDIEKDVLKLLNNSHYPISLNQSKEQGLILDGEIIIKDEDKYGDKAFQETSKLLKKDGKKQGLVYHVFDILKANDFEFDMCSTPYSARRKQLELLFKENNSYQWVNKVPVLYYGQDKDKIPAMLTFATNSHWEGLMLNTADGVYKCKRSSDILKLKKFYSSDVLVKDVYEGTQKYKGLLGGVIIQFKDFEVNVGSGFTDDERNLFWSNPEMIVGKIVEIQYFEESKNQNGGLSLRFPTFKQVRTDKTVDDISYES